MAQEHPASRETRDTLLWSSSISEGLAPSPSSLCCQLRTENTHFTSTMSRWNTTRFYKGPGVNFDTFELWKLFNITPKFIIHLLLILLKQEFLWAGLASAGVGANLSLMFQVNLKKGTITVPPDEPEVVQHICLAFVTATLYLLVQPRPPRVEEVVFPLIFFPVYF